MEYATYVMGKENFTIDPKVRQIRAVSIEETGTGYVITYAVPVELLPDPEGEA